MIEEIEVDGFRSLSKFKLKLKPGLNILIGPNGAGKSNIIHFFEFLSNLCNNSLSEAVNKSGGAGSVFQKLEKGTFIDQMRMKIRGSTVSPYTKNELRHVRYEYECVIEFSNENDVVFFRSQRMKLATNRSKTESQKIWDVDISSEISMDAKFVFQLNLNHIDLRKANLTISSFEWIPGRAERIRELSDLLRRVVGPEQTLLLAMQRLMRETKDVMPDFLGGMSLNVVPSIAKLYEDSAAPPGVRRDGSGLAPTLYTLLKRTGDSPISRRTPYVRYYPSQFSTRGQ